MSRIMNIVRNDTFITVFILCVVMVIVLVVELGGDTNSAMEESQGFVRDFNAFLEEANQGRWKEAHQRLIPPLQEKLGIERLEQIFRKSTFLGRKPRFTMFQFRKRGGAAELEGNLVGQGIETRVVVHYSVFGPKDQKGRSEFFISEVVVGGQPVFSVRE